MILCEHFLEMLPWAHISLGVEGVVSHASPHVRDGNRKFRKYKLTPDLLLFEKVGLERSINN